MCRYIPTEQIAVEPDSMWPSEGFSETLEIDINLAARSSAPVLITATPDHALKIARVIASRGDRRCTPDVVTCDPAAGGDVIAAITGNRLRLPSECGTPILLLREIHTLKASDQKAVMECLAERPIMRSSHAPRIIASSSIDLFERVRRGMFDARLFYWLNVIHIVVPLSPASWTNSAHDR